VKDGTKETGKEMAKGEKNQGKSQLSRKAERGRLPPQKVLKKAKNDQKDTKERGHPGRKAREEGRDIDRELMGR